MTTYQSPTRAVRTVTRAPEGLHSTARQTSSAAVVSSRAEVASDDPRVLNMVLAFSGQDILKSILRDHQHSSSIGEEVRGVTAGDNLLLKEETKTGLARVAIRLHVNVTTDGAASTSGVSQQSVRSLSCRTYCLTACAADL